MTARRHPFFTSARGRLLSFNLLMGVVNEYAVGMTVREEDKAFIARVYAYSFVGVLLDWVRDGMKVEPEAIVDRLALVLQGSIASALERFRLDKTLSKAPK